MDRIGFVGQLRSVAEGFLCAPELVDRADTVWALSAGCFARLVYPLCLTYCMKHTTRRARLDS